MMNTRILTLAFFALMAACGPPDEDGSAESDGPSDMPMPGMSAGASGAAGGMMDGMAAHMSMMAAMRGDSLMTNLPMHRQMVANMIARMNREMRDMSMDADPAWNATVDSLREDLVRMPDMGPAELEAMMPEHRARVMRLMEMHREMMPGMEM